MSECLLSVGLDVGTTSTQLIFSELTVENRAGSFSVPEMEIDQRRILYKSPVHFTPLVHGELVDAAALRQIVDREYEKAGIHKKDVDTGAIIITGETSRKENASAVLHELSGYAGDFVVAAAGPDLESILAAKGAGAVAYSENTGKTVLHMDIGGGTSNLALIEDGKITATGCLNVGGRLLKFDENGAVTYISPVLEGICDLKVGDIAAKQTVEPVAQKLTEVLEMTAGLREPTGILEKLTTKEGERPQTLGAAPLIDTGGKNVVISFSGGVADCIETERPWLSFGDMGPILGQAIRRSRLCRGQYVLGAETIRATVIGAGCHSAQLSGSTVFHQNIPFPVKNLPVVARMEDLSRLDGPGVLAIGEELPDYAAVSALSERIATGMAQPIFIAMEQDRAKALGTQLALRLGKDAKILCIDRVKLGSESYLDIGAPVGPALPVVVKTLVLSR